LPRCFQEPGIRQPERILQTSKEELCSGTGLQDEEPTYLTPTTDNRSYWVEEADFISFEEIFAKVTDDIFEETYSFTETDSDSTWEYRETEHTNWKTGWAEYYYYRSKITYSDPGLSESDSLNEIEIMTESNIKEQEESGNVSFPLFFSLFALIGLITFKHRN